MYSYILTNEFIVIAAVLIVAGAISGILAGLFGVGGGTVMVPVLHEVFLVIGVPEQSCIYLAIGTAFAVIIPTSIRSFFAHRRRGAVDSKTLRIWAVPVVLGVVLGVVIASHVTAGFLRAVFATVSIAVATKMMIGQDRWTLASDLPKTPGLAFYGLVIGTLSSWMGIGGGTFGNLIYALHNRPVHQGVATSAGLGVLIAIPGTIGFMVAGYPHMAELPPLSIGYVSLVGALALGIVSTAVAPLGVFIAHSFSRRTLELALALFLVVVGGRFLVNIFGGI